MSQGEKKSTSNTVRLRSFAETGTAQKNVINIKENISLQCVTLTKTTV